MGDATEAARWTVDSRPEANDPRLTGTVTAVSRPLENAQRVATFALQLAVDQQVGDYRGYSGSPVESDGVVVGILVEQLRFRGPVNPGERTPVANVLYAAPITEVLRNFNLTAGRESKVERPDPKRARAPLRVCMVSSEYPGHMVGGLGSHVEQLTQALSGNVDVDLVLPRLRSDEARYATPPSPRVALHPVPGVSPSYSSPVSWLDFADAATAEVSDLLTAGKAFTVVHCHDWVTVLVGCKVRWLHTIPLVFHVHLPNPAPLCASVENYGLLCADVITVSSRFMANAIRRRLQSFDVDTDTKPIRVVRNGVDLATFRPKEDCVQEGDYILFVGRLVDQKGLVPLIRAFQYVRVKFDNVHLKIVGTGTDTVGLKALRLSLGFTEADIKIITSPKWLSREQLAPLYQNAQVVVVPSIDEPFGMTALEALACGRPVVASNVGGLGELVDQQSGFLVEPRDELDLAQWLMKLLADRDLRERFGSAGRARLVREATYTWPTIANDVAALYRGVRTPVTGDIPAQAAEFESQIKRVAKEMAPTIQQGFLDGLFPRKL